MILLLPCILLCFGTFSSSFIYNSYPNYNYIFLNTFYILIIFFSYYMYILHWNIGFISKHCFIVGLYIELTIQCLI